MSRRPGDGIMRRLAKPVGFGLRRLGKIRFEGSFHHRRPGDALQSDTRCRHAHSETVL